LSDDAFSFIRKIPLRGTFKGLLFGLIKDPGELISLLNPTAQPRGDFPENRFGQTFEAVWKIGVIVIAYSAHTAVDSQGKKQNRPSLTAGWGSGQNGPLYSGSAGADGSLYQIQTGPKFGFRGFNVDQVTAG
jgi:hypothetical protein